MISFFWAYCSTLFPFFLYVRNVFHYSCFSSSTPDTSRQAPKATTNTTNKRLPVTLHFRPGPQTPSLKQSRYKMSSSLNFDSVIRFLRRKLGLQDHEGLFCYVNQVFAPAADEGVGNLWRVSCWVLGRGIWIDVGLTLDCRWLTLWM